MIGHLCSEACHAWLPEIRLIVDRRAGHVAYERGLCVFVPRREAVFLGGFSQYLESAFMRLRSALSDGVHKSYEAFYPKTIGAS